ncbi:hypothetical protein FQN57_005728 [Myotisia sp. PD_48]|nr:hypothetical protein FQN57_005728 [Myotisia sp. PD_48]
MSLPTSAAGPRITPYLVFLVCIITLGPLQFGYHLVINPDPLFAAGYMGFCAELNAPQAVITCEKKHITTTSRLPQCIPMTPSQFGFISSSYTLGGLLGALLAGPLSTKYGRLFTFRITTIFFMAGPLAATFASTIPIFCAGRLLSGVGAGAAIVVGPIYISEISPPKNRGFFGAFTQVMTNVGILLTQSLGYFLSRGNMWRIILAIAGLIGALQLVGLLFVPESPVWLAEHHKLTHAKRILQRIRGQNADILQEIKGWQISDSTGGTSANAEEEQESLLNQPSAANPPTQRLPVSILNVVLDPTYRPAIIAVIAVMVAQQFTGVNSIIMYSVSLLSAILPTTAALLTVMISGLNLVVTLVCAPLSDKLGRKTCLLLSIVGMGVTSALLAIGMASEQQLLSAISTLLFVASFALGLGPVPFILASELVGPEAVGATQSWALAANWISTFIVAQFFPALNEYMGGKGQVYWLFAAMAVISAAFIAWWVPETKGKTGIDEVWGRSPRRLD